MAKPTDTALPQIPKTKALRVYLYPARPKPDRDGRWTFNVNVDGYGTPAMHVRARNAKDAHDALGLAVYLKLDKMEDING